MNYPQAKDLWASTEWIAVKYAEMNTDLLSMSEGWHIPAVFGLSPKLYSISSPFFFKI